MESEQIRKIKELAKKDGFNDKEVDAILNHAKILTSKIIRDYLIEIAKEELSDKKTLDLLLETISELDVTNYVGCQKIQMKDNDDIILVIQIGVANKETHKFDILYKGPDMLKAIFFRIAKFMEMTNAQYKTMMAGNKKLYEMMCETIPNIDFSQLRINNNTWTMAFDEKSNMRIVPIVYYVDKKDRIVNLDEVDIRQPKSQIKFN